MEINFLSLLLAAFSTLVVGFVWYHPKVFGTIWMRESGTTSEKIESSNMVGIFAFSLIYAFLITMVLQTLVIHQFGAFGMIGGTIETAKPSYAAFMADYGNAFRTFKHGALHGFMTGLFMILPVIGVGALYERKSFKYVLISGGYWIVSMTIMGGIICMMK